MNNKYRFALLLLPAYCWAQNFPAIDQQNMQKMMQAADEMGRCMKQVDQNELNKLEKRAQEFEREAKSLCTQGKQNQAQDLAIDYAKELTSDATVKQIIKCSEHMKTAMQGMMPQLQLPDYEQKIDDLNQQVCGAYKIPPQQ